MRMMTTGSPLRFEGRFAETRPTTDRADPASDLTVDPLFVVGPTSKRSQGLCFGMAQSVVNRLPARCVS